MELYYADAKGGSIPVFRTITLEAHDLPFASEPIHSDGIMASQIPLVAALSIAKIFHYLLRIFKLPSRFSKLKRLFVCCFSL